MLKGYRLTDDTPSARHLRHDVLNNEYGTVESGAYDGVDILFGFL